MADRERRTAVWPMQLRDDELLDIPAHKAAWDAYSQSTETKALKAAKFWDALTFPQIRPDEHLLVDAEPETESLPWEFIAVDVDPGGGGRRFAGASWPGVSFLVQGASVRPAAIASGPLRVAWIYGTDAILHLESVRATSQRGGDHIEFLSYPLDGDWRVQFRGGVRFDVVVVMAHGVAESGRIDLGNTPNEVVVPAAEAIAAIRASEASLVILQVCNSAQRFSGERSLVAAMVGGSVQAAIGYTQPVLDAAVLPHFGVVEELAKGERLVDAYSATRRQADEKWDATRLFIADRRVLDTRLRVELSADEKLRLDRRLHPPHFSLLTALENGDATDATIREWASSEPIEEVVAFACHAPAALQMLALETVAQNRSKVRTLVAAGRSAGLSDSILRSALSNVLMSTTIDSLFTDASPAS